MCKSRGPKSTRKIDTGNYVFVEAGVEVGVTLKLVPSKVVPQDQNLYFTKIGTPRSNTFWKKCGHSIQSYGMTKECQMNRIKDFDS